MTVSELIEALKEMPQDKEVYFLRDNTDVTYDPTFCIKVNIKYVKVQDRWDFTQEDGEYVALEGDFLI